MTPPEIRKKEAISSDGGRDGKSDVGGDIQMIRYVMNLAAAAPVRRFPNCIPSASVLIFSPGSTCQFVHHRRLRSHLMVPSQNYA